MPDITKIKVADESESSYKLYPRNEEFAKRSGGGGSGVQSDWNQNDETKPDYVKNRPFYTGDPVETVLIEDINVSFSNPHASIYYGAIPTTIELIAGNTYKVSWDGATYECVCELFMGNHVIGNQSITGAGADTGEPFLILPLADNQGTEVYTLDTSTSHTISISGSVAAEVVKIPDKYISNTFRDIVNAGNPLLWTDDEWNDYYALFLSGKLLQINTDIGSLKRGYVLSMSIDGARHISLIDSVGNIYSLNYNNAAGEFYWRPFFQLNEGLYLNYEQAASEPSEETLKYAALKAIGPELIFKTQKANEKFVERKVVLEGNKELILSSSTANSTKKFRITVDDSGTITATEVS